ncbi:hypothetical protein M407DRAFT_211051 [Tulasnella calospora MUT 4182]|uniref:F-box domain-containing protein n=1 Tax=Tulasnella calospora MUT 4182 TaxID=1051891 RepID=A0A0C3Q0L0_9AGAM|nr:hypothetical protein M407DRAFT_211051 [Tulasnella calospora MUT 4182]
MPSKRLKELRITSRVITDNMDEMGLDFVDDFQSFLAGFNQLRRVVLDRHFATGEVITVLGTLEHVEYLEIIGTLYQRTLETSMTETRLATFPALQELIITLNSRNIPFFQDSQNITSPMFSTFKVIYNGNSAAHLRDLFAIIASRWPQLRILHIHPPIGFYQFIEEDAKMMDLYQKPERISRIARSFITGEIIKPLLDLTLLEELAIEWPYPARLDKRSLKDMVAFWPNLRCLYLTPIPFVILPERPFIHFEDLAIFSRSKSLEKLAMFCDATYPRPTHSRTEVEVDVWRLNTSTVDPSRCTSLRSFDPGYSWINHPHVVVSRLKQIFPNANLPRWRIEDRQSRWGEVARRVWRTL